MILNTFYEEYLSPTHGLRKHIVYVVQCDVCGNVKNKRDARLKYRKNHTCSLECKKNAHKNGGCIERLRAKTNLEKFGTENTFASEKCKEKMNETWKTSINGGPHSKKSRQKAKSTLIENYGELGIGSKEIQDRTVTTMIKNHGVERPMQMQSVKDSLVSGSLAKYGTEYTSRSVAGREKMFQTTFDRHGVYHPLQKSKIRDRIEQTTLERFGSKNISQSEYFANLPVRMGTHECDYYSFRDQQIWYRSSYERRFLEWCDKNKDLILEIKMNICVDYTFENVEKKYFIDFGVHYKDGKKILYEIKSTYGCTLPQNQTKFLKGKESCQILGYDNFVVITEDSLNELGV